MFSHSLADIDKICSCEIPLNSNNVGISPQTTTIYN